ncbi:ribonuclease H-like domain-containing protein [Tanacetum coccineum]
MDTGATSHLISNARNLSTIFNKRLFPSIHVGDGNSIPVTNTEHSIIPSIHCPLHLHNVLITLNIIKNLIYVRQFTRDNNCTIEFDAFGFSVKDFLTRHILLQCDSSGDLYPVTKPSTTPTAFLSTSASTWHQRLGHLGDEVLRPLVSRFSVCLSSALLQQIIDSLHNEFDMTDLEALNYFLGISADRNSTCLFLSQKKHALQLLERPHMVYCNPSRTPIDTESKLDLSYAIQQVCLYMHDPREPHFATLKHILRYVRGTVDFGLQLYASATTSLVGYTDADWAGKRQHTLSRSSVKAEYHGVANVVTETAWLRNLLRGLHSPLSTVTLVYCDNVSAVYISTNPAQHQQIKHIEIDIHFVRDMVTAGHVKVLHVSYHY